MEVYTVGFTKKTAAQFFGTLKNAGIKRLLDVRLNNASQLARFARREDLPFFLKELCGIEYVHEPQLAPTKNLLRDYRKKNITWSDYERRFCQLMADRKIETTLNRDLFALPTALLCSEATAEQCHRRLILEYLQQHGSNLQIIHL